MRPWFLRTSLWQSASCQAVACLRFASCGREDRQVLFARHVWAVTPCVRQLRHLKSQTNPRPLQICVRCPTRRSTTYVGPC